ncbi:ICE protein [Aphomia sociella]
MDETDAFPFGKSSKKSAPQEKATVTQTTTVIRKSQFDPDALHYDMSGKKYLYIFNHYNYMRTQYFGGKQPSPRNGTYADVESLTNVFKSIDFEVFHFDNLIYSEMRSEVLKLVNQDNSQTSCICVAFMTHGDESGYIYAKDRPFCLNVLMSEFQSPNLATIPKIFFIQACRGKEADDGQFVATDSIKNPVIQIPSHIDFLTLCPTIEGYVAFRDVNGSWMIQELCNVISEHYKDFDILQLMTLVNKRVAFGRTSFNPNSSSYHNKKQTLEFKSTLTKFLKFS